MTGQEMKTVIEFEKSLTKDAPVRIRWTNCHRFMSGLGHVKKINQQSVIVTLIEEVSGQDVGSGDCNYSVGMDIKVPLLTAGSGGKLWSANNRAEPKNGY